MSVMLGQLYYALREAGVSETLAQEASEEVYAHIVGFRPHRAMQKRRRDWFPLWAPIFSLWAPIAAAVLVGIGVLIGRWLL